MSKSVDLRPRAPAHSDLAVNKEVVDLLERKPGGLREEEVQEDGDASIRDSPGDVIACADGLRTHPFSMGNAQSLCVRPWTHLNSHRRDHDNDEVEDCR